MTDSTPLPDGLEALANPPAFPVVAENGLGHVSEGMSLRDWFAGQALVGMGSTVPASPSGARWASHCIPAVKVRVAYEIADAMLRERMKGGAS